MPTRLETQGFRERVELLHEELWHEHGIKFILPLKTANYATWQLAFRNMQILKGVAMAHKMRLMR